MPKKNKPALQSFSTIASRSECIIQTFFVDQSKVFYQKFGTGTKKLVLVPKIGTGTRIGTEQALHIWVENNNNYALETKYKIQNMVIIKSEN